MPDRDKDLQPKSVAFRLWALALCLSASFIALAPAVADDDAVKQTVTTFIVYPSPYPATGKFKDALNLLRNTIRVDRSYIILLYQPGTPTFDMAARSTQPALTLDHPLSADEMMALSASAGAQFYAIASSADSNDKAIELSLVKVGGDSSAVWHWAGSDIVAGAHELMNGLRAAVNPTFADLAAAQSAAKIASTDTWGAVATSKAPPEGAPLSLGVVAPASPSAPPAVTVQTEPLQNSPTPDSPQSMPAAPAALPAAVPPLPVAPPAALAAPPASAPAKPASPQPVRLPSSLPAAAADDAFTGDVVASDRAPSTSDDTGSRDHAAIGDDARKKLNEAQSDMQQSNLFAAIDAYRQAVNLSPYATSIRLSLAQTYLQAGYTQQAIDEARRALTLDPQNQDVAQFIKGMSARGLIAPGDPTALLAAVSRDPGDVQAWLALGDSYAASAQTDRAEDAYEHAASLQPSMPDAPMKLVGLYLKTGKYDLAAGAYKKAGTGAYVSTLRMISSAADNVFNSIRQSAADYDGGTITREGYYRQANKADAIARSLQTFVGGITAPADQNVGYLHLSMAVQLMAQATEAWVSFIETNDEQYRSQAVPLEQDARRELKTAMVAANAALAIDSGPGQ